MQNHTQLATKHNSGAGLPPILAGNLTPDIRRRVEEFYFSVASCFESWVTRRQSPHTQRAYREDVMAFVKFAGIEWPDGATELLRVSVRDVQAFRDHLQEHNAAPKTLNRRISSLSSFYKYLAAAAAELRLPITVPNPAHAQFISRESTDPREERRALSATRARQLMGLPAGDHVLDFRDRAILRVFLYSGARLSTVCRLKVSDFHQDGDQATIRLHEKGDKRRTIGLHFAAAQAIGEYIEKAEIKSGPLFRPRLNPRSKKLAQRHMDAASLYRLVQSYMIRLPGAAKEEPHADGSTATRCLYTPAFSPGHHRHPAARFRRGHPKSSGPPRPPPHHHDPNLRQAKAQHGRERQPRRADLKERIRGRTTTSARDPPFPIPHKAAFPARSRSKPEWYSGLGGISGVKFEIVQLGHLRLKFLGRRTDSQLSVGTPAALDWNCLVLLYFGDFVLVVHKNDDWIQIREFGWFEPRFSENDDLVARVEMSRRRAIEANLSLSALARHRVSLPEYAIRNIGDIYILERLNAALLKQFLVYRDRANIVQRGLGHSRPMDLGHACPNQHISLLVCSITAPAARQRAFHCSKY